MTNQTTITETVVKKTDHAEAKKKAQERKTTLWRITIGCLVLLLISVSLYFLSKGISKAFNLRESDSVAKEVDSDYIRATTEPDLNQPEVPVVSDYNIIYPSDQPTNQPTGRVLGETTTRQPIPAPSYTGQPSCPDYLGNRVACVQNPPGYNPATYSQPTYQPRDQTYSQQAATYYQPQTYYPQEYYSAYDSYPYYQNSQELSPGRCSDYLGDRYACLPPHYTMRGPLY